MSDTPPQFSRTAYSFDLPPELVAQEPAARRDESRLLVVHADAEEHRVFRDLPEFLRPDDLLVINSVRVQPARFFARRPTGARVEVFVLGCEGDTARALLRGNSPLRDGDVLLVPCNEDNNKVPLQAHALPGVGPSDVPSDDAHQLIVVGPPGDGGIRDLRVPGSWLTPAALQQLGAPPLPPYIRRGADDPRLTTLDRERDQTVYAESDIATDFSVAAPTAGLHFTPELLAAAESATAGPAVRLQLEVGAGTFQPVRADDIREHPMHSERFRVTADELARLRSHRQAGGRVVAVGTTSARVLETLARMNAGATNLPATIETLPDGSIRGDTAIFIHPPQRPTGFDALLTNFHLPESTLLMLVSAVIGRDRALAIYRDAVHRRYRFFSYGDAMFIRDLA